MAQTTQIVPKFSFPYVQTVINDYTQVSQTTDATAADDTVKYVFAFTSGMGIDNVFVRKKSRSSAVATYGDSNYKKYGQPLMQALAVLEQENTSVWCMRVMPENAAYANNIVSMYYKIDEENAYPDSPSKRKFRIKFTQKNAIDATKKSSLQTAFKTLDGIVVQGSYKDSEGFTQVPLLIVNAAGRGSYGNNYCVRITQNYSYEKEYGIKMYNFDTMTVDGGLTKIANYVGGLCTSSKYTAATLINDVLEDTETGVAPVDIYASDDNLEGVYDAYIAFCEEQHKLLQEEYETKLVSYAIPSGMLDGSIPVTEEYLDKVTELNNIQALIDATDEDALPDFDEFDPFFGIKVADTDSYPMLCYVQKLTSDIDTEAEDYDANDYTKTDILEVGSTKGIVLSKGGNGYFDTPRTETDTEGKAVTQWTYEDEVNECLVSAYDGTYDRRILAPRRIPADALWDANYAFKVKTTLASLSLLRNDAILYLDTGISDTSYSGSQIGSLIRDYSVFNSPLISKNLQHYTIKESTTQKRVVVSITYFLSMQYAYHMAEYGSHIPFVKGRAQLTGHVKDSLEPTVEDYESDLKETLYDNRFNYFETLDENVFQRGTQSTSQAAETDLTEESNTTTLYIMKRIIEQDIQQKLYDFSDETTRAAFKSTEEAAFADWIGNRVLSLSIDFKVNAWEGERSILHAYLSVVFRGLQKRAIVEIDINKRTYASATATDAESEE